jgi:peptidoglycan/LPS O-acetylase OafA/YrhL
MATRFNELDSLRGLAACTVVLNHFFDATYAETYYATWNSPLRMLIAGHNAVTLFFVLSGFVLFLPYERSVKPRYPGYIVKRICRIYLPYLGALALAVAMNFHFHGLVINDSWISQTWNEKPHLHGILQHIAFLGDYPWTRFNTAFWSLVYEMRISLVFPFLAIGVLRLRTGWMFLLAAFSSLLSDHCNRIFALMHLNAPPSEATTTLHFMSFFILGAILAKNRKFFQTQFRKLSPVFVIFLFALAIALYYSPFDVPAAAGKILSVHKINDWGVAFGALLIITLALDWNVFKKVLNHRAVNYLGTISYSMYLVHGTVVFTFIYLIQGHLTLVYLPIYLVTVLIVASIFYYLIEMPSMMLGRRLGKNAGSSPSALSPLNRQLTRLPTADPKPVAEGEIELG